MKQLITLCAALLLTLQATAQNDSIPQKKKKERKVELTGEVYDSFTKAKVKALVTMMRQDSTVVDTMTCWTWGTSSYYEFKVPAVQAKYIVKATADGYEDTYMDYELRHIARNSWFEMPRILMKKKQRDEDDIYKEVDLNGVVVTGTKVKIAYRGDTIVYNASAFNLPEGSMLDGLIRQMPGAELKDNGDIYINGKKVDYLTLNGKDFFKGNNKVMLDNLPYYTVKDIKVFNKSTKESELVGHDIEAKDYVMDVSLKREYNRGYMGNVETGAGTDNRYMARLFALYYDDHTRLSLFGNTNNINENRHPGNEGEWRPSDMPQGLQATKQTGLSLSTEDKDKRWEDNFDATFDWSDADNWSRTASETFATQGNIMGGSEAMSRQKDFRFSANDWFRVQKPFTAYGNLSVSYTDGRRHSASQDSTYRDYVINQTQNLGLNRYRTLSTSGYLSWYKRFEWGDFFSINLSSSYYRQKPSENFSRQDTRYAQTGTADQRDYYTDTHNDGYNYRLSGRYTLQMPNRFFISPWLAYSQEQRNNYNSNYRLDWLGDMTRDNRDLGWLPSTRETLAGTLDADNSDNHTDMTRTYTGAVEVYRSDDNQYFSVSLPVNNVHERMHYTDARLDTVARRSYTNIAPRIDLYRWGIKRGLQHASYSMDVSRPSLASLMPTDDTTNPLYTRINNPGLKARVTHNASIAFQADNDSTKHFFRLWSNANLTRNAWGTRTTYNQDTGAYTYQNDNINGNWYWGMGLSYQQPIDRKKHLTLTQRADAEYTHSVDFDIQYLTTAQQPIGNAPKSTVNNWTLHERLGLEYQLDKLTVTASGEVEWRSATGDRQNFERISAFDYSYGATLKYTVPWVKLTLGTDIRMFSRRGYNSDLMNTDNLVWNGELSRTLWKEKLTVKLTAFDLLHQLSNTQYSVNAQGRTETWNNCIPRYVMLTAIYKLNITPKQK